MDDWELGEELRGAAERVRALSRRATPNPEHKAALRAELLQRHAQLYRPGGERSRDSFMRRCFSRRRMFVVAPLALTAAVLCLFLVGALQIAGRQSPQSADAARIATRLVSTAPTITGWQWTLRQTRDGMPAVHRLGAPLTPYQRLYIRDGRSYLYSYGKWFLVEPAQSAAPATFNWQWAFAAIASRLAQGKFTRLPDRIIAGQPAYGIRYIIDQRAGNRVIVSAWLDRQSGLVSQLQALFFDRGEMVESDTADYTYVRGR